MSAEDDARVASVAAKDSVVAHRIAAEEKSSEAVESEAVSPTRGEEGA